MSTRGAAELAAWMQLREITQRQAAEALRVSGPTVHDWVHGRKRPRPSLRALIASWTHGAVPVDSWLSDEARAALAADRGAA